MSMSRQSGYDFNDSENNTRDSFDVYIGQEYNQVPDHIISVEDALQWEMNHTLCTNR